MTADRAPPRNTTLPHCDGCGLLDSGIYGFKTPGAQTKHFCGECTPSRTGSVGMPKAAPAAPEPAPKTSPQADLFGRAA